MLSKHTYLHSHDLSQQDNVSNPLRDGERNVWLLHPSFLTRLKGTFQNLSVHLPMPAIKDRLYVLLTWARAV